jgi:hypothetical protein
MTGRKGKKNWLVTGMTRAAMRREAMRVLRRGLGNCMTQRQKMPRMARRTY